MKQSGLGGYQGSVEVPMSDLGEFEVVCATCHRLEVWSPGQPPRVQTEGGVRRPKRHPDREAWDVVRRCLDGSGRVVAICPGCDQPLVAPSAQGMAIPWQIPVAGGTITVDVDGGVIGPDGALTVAEAEGLVDEATTPRFSLRGLRLHVAAFQTVLLVLMLGPVVAFSMALLSLSVFMHPAAGKWAALLSRVAAALGVS